MKDRVITFAKIVLPIAIIAWLLTSIEPDTLEQLRQQPKQWALLSIAICVAILAVCLTFFRWYLLVRALHMPFRIRDAFRLGFLGYLLNFVSVGSVGGDLFKAVFIAREQPSRQAEAVATVVVDRVIGLYALLLVTSGAILLSDVQQPSPALRAICDMTFVATAVGGGFILMMLIPGFTRGSVSEFLARLPKVGHTIEQLINSVRMYRNKRGIMVLIFAMSMLVHCLLTVSVYLIAVAIFTHVPPLREHLIIVPLSNVAGALPFTPAGLGTFEFAMKELYEHVPSDGPGDVVGVLVALAFRLVTIVIAAVGVVYYWSCRKEVQEVLDAAEHMAEEERQPANTP